MRISAFLCCVALPGWAGPPVLELPLECDLGKSCFVEDYPDMLPDTRMSDYTCGLKSRDGHKGTDFGLISYEQMAAGVPVLASAAGVVRAIRDGVEDVAVTAETRANIEGIECGNAVAISHGDGWETLYCHMRKGSVTVTQGQTVAAGDQLGLVGMSGLTNFPHLHISVYHNQTAVDPFKPSGEMTCGDTADNGLWADAPDYQKSGLFSVGFSDGVPEFSDIKSGAARRDNLRPTDAIVLYGHSFYPEAGDVMRLTIKGPNDFEFDQSVTIEKTQAQLFRAVGKKAPSGGWPSGEYTGRVETKRGDTVIAVRFTKVTVE